MGYVLVASTVVEQGFTVALDQYPQNTTFGTFQKNMSYALNIRSTINREMLAIKRRSIITEIHIPKRVGRSKSDIATYLYKLHLITEQTKKRSLDNPSLVQSVKYMRRDGGLKMQAIVHANPAVQRESDANTRSGDNIRGGPDILHEIVRQDTASLTGEKLAVNTKQLYYAAVHRRMWTIDAILAYLLAETEVVHNRGSKEECQTMLLNYFLENKTVDLAEKAVPVAVAVVVA
jgi:hypothetical protein